MSDIAMIAKTIAGMPIGQQQHNMTIEMMRVGMAFGGSPWNAPPDGGVDPVPGPIPGVGGGDDGGGGWGGGSPG